MTWEILKGGNAVFFCFRVKKQTDISMCHNNFYKTVYRNEMKLNIIFLVKFT